MGCQVVHLAVTHRAVAVGLEAVVGSVEVVGSVAVVVAG